MLDHFVSFFLDPGKAEGCRGLHRRELDGGFPELQYDVLDENEPPGFSAEELVEPGWGPFTKAQDRCSLERILPDVVDPGHIHRDLGTRPALRLFVKLVLKIVHPNRTEFRSSEIEDLMASGGPWPPKHRPLVLPLPLVLLRLVPTSSALEDLVPYA